MTYRRCETCGGKKEVVGLGSMKKKCASCDGVGYTGIKDTEDKVVVSDKPVVKKVVKKAGIPSKKKV